MNSSNTMVGSPPHTRGIRLAMTRGRQQTRFTPAYAGNTDDVHHVGFCAGVHPRIRGEYCGRCPLCAPCAGSPPHTRGILPDLPASPARCGFTPAYAGNTWVLLLSAVLRRVHPRIRGEYYECANAAVFLMGSPPHTRGIPLRRLQIIPQSRFTPAYAGNTLLHPSRYSGKKVHPRIRGEYL